jgi:hypothetical protein
VIIANRLLIIADFLLHKYIIMLPMIGANIPVRAIILYTLIFPPF